jgi:RNA polymerase sigma-70 factor (ECF subfamily)
VDQNDQDFDRMINFINEAIENLPKKCKEIFVLSKKEGYTNMEIAEILSISIKTVESQITIAFKQIKKEMAIYNF